MCLVMLNSHRIHGFSQGINHSCKYTCEFNHAQLEYSLNVDITIITFSKKTIKHELNVIPYLERQEYVSYEGVALRIVIAYAQFFKLLGVIYNVIYLMKYRALITFKNSPNKRIWFFSLPRTSKFVFILEMTK